MPESNLHKLSALGQSVWIDFLSRQMLQSGKLARMMEEDAVVGVTSNPTIFQKAISEGDAYDEQLQRAARSGEEDAKEIFLTARRRATSRDACDLLRKVWDEGEGLDGYVSMGGRPDLAYDRDGTIAAGAAAARLDRQAEPYVKIPATEPGPRRDRGDDRAREEHQRHADLLARAPPGSDGGLHPRSRAARRERRRPESGALGRELLRLACRHRGRQAARRDRRGRVELKGKLAIANAKLAYQNYLETFQGERWEALEAKGASKQRCLWASTSTKNPDYRDVMYVEELIGPDTVNTMPEETIRAFQDHGEVEVTLTKDVEAAREAVRRARGRGIDYDDVANTLESEGVQKFVDSFKELLDGIEAKRGELVSA